MGRKVLQRPHVVVRHERLTARVEPTKVAFIAVMRKLASMLNPLLHEGRMWQAEPHIYQLEAVE